MDASGELHGIKIRLAIYPWSVPDLQGGTSLKLHKFTLADVCETIVAVPANVAVFSVEPDDCFVIRAMSPALASLYNTTPEDAEGIEVQDFKYPEETIRRLRQTYIRCRDSGTEVTQDEELPVADGPPVWTNRTVTPLLNDNGEVIALISTVLDITDLVKARKKLVRTLSATAAGFVTICAWCRNIQEDNSWISLDEYVSEFSEPDKALCPECQANLSR